MAASAGSKATALRDHHWVMEHGSTMTLDWRLTCFLFIEDLELLEVVLEFLKFCHLCLHLFQTIDGLGFCFQSLFVSETEALSLKLELLNGFFPGAAYTTGILLRPVNLATTGEGNKDVGILELLC